MTSPCAPHRVYGDCGVCALLAAIAAIASLRAQVGEVAR
jgi:hypothetical protein